MAEVDLTTKLKAFPKIKSITVTDEKHIQLKWSKVALAEKYDIKRSESPSGPFTHIEWAKKPEFTDETAEKDITYWYKVIAWKRMEGKKTSTKASAVKPVVISDIPAVENLKAKTKNKKIILTWDKGEGDKFFIYRRSDHFSRPVYIGESKKGEFTDECPVSGQAYHYTVQCAKKSEEKLLHGNFSKEVDGVFLDGTEILSVKTTFGRILALLEGDFVLAVGVGEQSLDLLLVCYGLGCAAVLNADLGNAVSKHCRQLGTILVSCQLKRGQFHG